MEKQEQMRTCIRWQLARGECLWGMECEKDCPRYVNKHQIDERDYHNGLQGWK